MELAFRFNILISFLPQKQIYSFIDAANGPTTHTGYLSLTAGTTGRGHHWRPQETNVLLSLPKHTAHYQYPSPAHVNITPDTHTYLLPALRFCSLPAFIPSHTVRYHTSTIILFPYLPHSSIANLKWY